MAETTQPTGLDPEQYLGVVRAALEPDERKFFKAYLGQESPNISDYLMPQGRFDQARQLREHINRAVLGEAIKQSQAPTVGQAQTIYPNFPTPPEAMKTTPQAPLQSAEMPVLQNTQQVQVPDNRMQGPMPGVKTPLGDAIPQWFAATNQNPLNREDTQSYLEKGPEFYQEGPRPLRTISVGQYGPDTAPSQATVMDPSTKLPPAFQAQLAALTHQTSLQQRQPHALTEADINLRNQARLEQIIATGQEAYPGEKQLLENRLFIYNKTTRPDSLEGQKLSGEVTKTQAEASVAPQKVQADLADVQNRAQHTAAQTQEIRTLLDAKLQELLSRVDLHKAQGSVLAGKAELAEFREKLGIDNLKWKVIHTLLLTDDLDKGSKLTGIKSLIENDPNLQVRAQDPSFLGKLFGQTSGSGIKIEPRQGESVRTPVLPPVQSTTPNPTPVQPQAQVPPQDDTVALRSMGLTMKEGETKDYKGQKYRRKGGKLEKVN